LKYKEVDIFYGDLNNVTELKKEDMYLKIFKKDKEIARLYFGNTLSVSIED
ncbi:hypothetical protein V8322_002946, partial [Listeria monocytogenes]